MTNQSYKHCHRHALLLIAAIVCGAVLLLLFPRAGSTHEPITTKVMFNKEVIRILERNCLGCHAPGKIKADIPLTTYEEARPWAKAIKEEILEKRMMPYQAVKGYGSFQHDYALPQRDVELLVSWIEGGAPRGDIKDYPKDAIEKLINSNEWKLGQPDLVLQPGQETKIAAEGDDEIRCFTLPTGLKEDRLINAIDFQPGNGAIVHNAWIAVERGPQSKVIKAAKRANNNCPSNVETLGQWIPGQSITRLPDGVATRLPAGSRIVLKIRYRKNGEAATDRSRIGIYFAKESISRTIRQIAINAPATVIPPNVENHRIKAAYSITEPTEIVAIRPLLFPFAKSIEATAYRPDGTVEVLIWAKDYRFDWQPTYFFKKPIALPKGARIEVTAYLDNSENNRNNPNDPPAQARFADALCEIALTSTPPIKTATLKQARK
jgi:hypothetical protein